MNPDAKQTLTEWLVLEAQRGSEGAFRDLHDLWCADLRRLALCKVEHPGAADEVSAEAWLAIARGLGHLDDGACFPRWAFRIVARRAADWIRRRGLQRRREAAARRETDALAPAAMIGVAEPGEELLQLRAAIAGLPADQRELLHLFYDLDRSVAEIAEIIDVPVGTVKSRLFSVRENLKRQLEKKIP